MPIFTPMKTIYIEDLIKQFKPDISNKELSRLKTTIQQQRLKLIDLIIYGECIEDQDGNRIDPLNHPITDTYK